MMENSLYQIRVYFSRFAEFLSEHFSAQKDLYSARWESLHKLARLSISRKYVAQKMTAFLICLGQFNQVFCVMPTQKQRELGNIYINGKTRSGKGLNIGANLLRWPYPVVVNDIKREHSGI